MTDAMVRTGIANDWSGGLEQLKEQGFELTEDGWVFQGQSLKKPVLKTLMVVELTISEPIITEGGDLLIITEKLSFTGRGSVSSGYRGDAPDGLAGAAAGSISIVAKEILTLRASSKGQRGGQGRPGLDATGVGQAGRNGDPGIDAKCRSTHGTDGQDGEDGERGPPGGPGGSGAVGGPSGDITIRYLTSNLNFNAPPANVLDVSGGDGGAGGSRGQGGRGGPGGRGGAGGRGKYCRPVGENGEGVELEPGDPGEDGTTGPSGYWGAIGAVGARGRPGRFTIHKFASEVDFFDEAARLAPALFGGLLAKAEMLYLLNREEEARPILEKIKPLTGGDGKPRPDALRATTLISQIQSSLTYFGEAKDAASAVFKNSVDANNIPWSLDDVRANFSQMTSEVQASESVLLYRRKQEWDGRRVEEAYRLEGDKLAKSIGEFEKDIEGFVGEIANLETRLRAFGRQAQELVDRIRRLIGQLVDLPGNVQSAFGELFGAIDGAIGHLGTIGAALTAPTISWPVVALGFTNFLGSMGQAENAAKRLLELGNHLKAQIEKAKDDLFYIRNEMSNIEATIAKLALKKVSAQQRIGEYRQMLQNLDNWWNSKDVAALAELVKIAERAHRDIRMSVAKDIYKLLRYVDLRTGRRDGLKPQMPPDGLNDAFNLLHMQSILRGISSLLVNEPPTAVVDEELATFQRDQYLELFAGLDGGAPMNIVVSQIPRGYERARVRAVAVMAHGELGAPISIGKAHVANCSVQFFAAAKMRFLVPQYIVPIPFGQFDDNARIFAFQSPLTTWAISLTRTDIQSFSLVFKLEVPVTGMTPPPQDRTPVRAWEGLGIPPDRRPPWEDISRLETMADAALDR
jgi:hypothetical protein